MTKSTDLNNIVIWSGYSKLESIMAVYDFQVYIYGFNERDQETDALHFYKFAERFLERELSVEDFCYSVCV